ncbi:MAG: YihY family inner membrane protein [Tatlockia sp.]|nr:YihY family inner membrane protein [Tatlockia sp.]
MDWKEKIINKIYEGARFIRFVAIHFINDDCTYRASALAFTSLLAVIPLMTVGFAVLSSFPVFDNLAGPIEDFVFDNFVPATGKTIQGYLKQFTAQVSHLSIWGLAILFITAILVMVTIERAMNVIWRAPSSRQGVSAFLLYWAILSLGPVFLGLSFAASSYIFSLPFIQNSTPSILITMVPFLLSLVGFTFLYVVVPNRPVKVKHGLGGGIIAAILFETAKQAFAYYLSRYNSYQLLYGAFAIVPIFFIWVYWLWIITLLGAEISYAFSVHHQRRRGKPLDGFSHSLLWLHRLWLKQKEGKGASLDELINCTKHPFAVDIDEMANSLIDADLIHTTNDGLYMLSRDLEETTLHDLSQMLPYKFPTQEELEDLTMTPVDQWRLVFKKNDKELQHTLGIKLNQLFSQPDQVLIS